LVFVALAVREPVRVLDPRTTQAPSMIQTSAFRSTNNHAAQAFIEFKAKHGHSYSGEEHQTRAQIFHKRFHEIQKHNGHLPQHPWRAGVNWLADRTENELVQLRGYRRHHRQTAKASVSLIEENSCSSQSMSCHDGTDSAKCCAGLLCGAKGSCQKPSYPDKLPSSHDWSKILKDGGKILNQGDCGSCWAIAAQGAIESQAAMLTNHSVSLSAQGMLGCTPNPQECGGTGGCNGATSELAFDWAKDNGVDLLSAVPYSATSVCPTTGFSSLRPAVFITGFVRLEENKAQKVLEALVTVGPMAAAADASGWFSYSTGIFNDCPASPTVDHAVLLVGYGKGDEDNDGGHAYWKIRNSWGEEYGEAGFLRLRRHAPDGEERCGWDNEPLQGVGCKGGPEKLWVCGECGILSDVNYPVGTTVPDSLLSF